MNKVKDGNVIIRLPLQYPTVCYISNPHINPTLVREVDRVTIDA